MLKLRLILVSSLPLALTEWDTLDFRAGNSISMNA